QVAHPRGDEDAYQHYRSAGGEASGGFCSVVRRARPRAALFVVAVGLLAALARRHLAQLARRRGGQAARRGRVGRGQLFLLLAAVSLVARPARAQTGGSLGGSLGIETAPPTSYRSPQQWAIELRFGPYRPDVDSEFGGRRKPYE